MTAHTETIANLVGKLVFQVDPTKLQTFNQMMLKASKQMAKLGQEYSKLANQMSRGLKLKIDTGDADKAKAKLQHAMKRELRAETELQKARRSAFQAEASQKKWLYSGEKERANLVTALVKDQRQHAVEQAKAHNALQQANGVTRQQVASQGQLMALKAKQARLDFIHAKTQAITQKRDANHLLTQSKAQQIQTVTGRILAQQQHQAIQHQARIASLAAATNAKQTAANNANQKHQWASQKHAVWQANQAARAAKAANAPSGGGFSGMVRGGIGGIGIGIAEALGPVGMALAGVTAALTFAANKMQERIEKRQEGVVEAQTFNNKFTSISKNPQIAKEFRDSFIESQNTNGSAIDNDTASDFRVLASGMLASNKSKDEIMKTWNLRQAAFAVAGTSKDDNKELNKQLNQLASDGTGTKADADILNNRMPMILPYVVKEYMKEDKITDYQKGLRAFNKDLKDGKGIKDSWYTGAFQNLVANSADSLKTNRESVASNLQRGANHTFLQDNGINSDPAMAVALNERAEASKRLTDSMLPLNQAFERLDKNLTNLDTGAINLTAKIMNLLSGKNSDGTEDVNDKPRFKIGMKHRYADEEPDYLKTISSWLGLGSKQESKPETMEGFNPKNVIQLDGFQQMAQLYKQYESPSFSPITAAATTNNIGGTQISAPITIEGSKVNIELHGSATDEDRAKIMDAVTTKLDERTSALTLQMPGIAKEAINNAFGQARALQAEHQ